jgi:16S rRNA (cytidine1402-2'-O)-methyltransferase
MEAKTLPRENCRIVGTPIGNLRDLSPRAAEALNEADVIFAEDTRTARGLLNHLKLSKPLESYHKDNEEKAAGKIIKFLSESKKIALISEAGMPGISDPGLMLTSRLVEAKIPFEVIPGACAAINAFLSSGLSKRGQFLFYGFLPRKGTKTALLKLKKIPFPIVFYESPRRIAETAGLLLEIFTPPIAVCRELTKLYEEVICLNSLEDIEKIRCQGEFTIVVNNETAENPVGETDFISTDKLAQLLKEKGVSGADIADLLKKLGIRRNKAYKAAIDTL